jgi:5'-3' exonuclease
MNNAGTLLGRRRLSAEHLKPERPFRSSGTAWFRREVFLACPGSRSPAPGRTMAAIAVSPVADDRRARKLLLAVDAPSLLHRNHHARAHTRITDRSGRPAWALNGMLRQILEAIEGFAPDAVIFGLDDRTASERKDFYPDYKAGRTEKDPQLIDQLERAGALLDALGLATLTPPGLEADDVNASAAAWARSNDWSCIIITSDRDAFACISDHTQVLRLINGRINGSPLLNPGRLRAMYGVAAARYLEYAALRGDVSDNLPGVPGIGEKMAAILLEQAGPMQTVWADMDHNEGRAVAAAVDSWAEETGARRVGTTVVRRLSAPQARERYDFNVRVMTGRDDLDLGLTPDLPGSPGLLPLDLGRVSQVVGFLDVQATTDLAVRVLSTDPASVLEP